MALKFTNSLLLLASVVCLSEACCPERWMQLGDVCYRYYGLPQTWSNADTVCRQEGGSLVSIHSYTENNNIYQLWKSLVNHPTNKESAYWIGLNDMSSETNFRWTDGSPTDYTYWNPGEPNDGRGEDCGHVQNWGSNDSERQKWNDHECENKQAFFCQRNLS